MEATKAFPQPLAAVQISSDSLRVTFRDADACKAAHINTHVPIFGVRCAVQGGGPPLTMVHIFDYPAEFVDDPVLKVLSGFGDVKSVKRQTYIGQPHIETGTRLVLMAFRATPPRLVNINGYFCRLWYKGQPLICNLCNVQGHKSAVCPNRDKCRRCGESGHFARTCPLPWGRAAAVVSAPSGDFPPLPSAEPSGVSFSSTPSASLAPPRVPSAVVDQVVEGICDDFLDSLSASDISSVADCSDFAHEVSPSAVGTANDGVCVALSPSDDTAVVVEGVSANDSSDTSPAIVTPTALVSVEESVVVVPPSVEGATVVSSAVDCNKSGTSHSSPENVCAANSLAGIVPVSGFCATPSDVDVCANIGAVSGGSVSEASFSSESVDTAVVGISCEVASSVAPVASASSLVGDASVGATGPGACSEVMASVCSTNDAQIFPSSDDGETSPSLLHRFRAKLKPKSPSPLSLSQYRSSHALARARPSRKPGCHSLPAVVSNVPR